MVTMQKRLEGSLHSQGNLPCSQGPLDTKVKLSVDLECTCQRKAESAVVKQTILVPC